MASINVNGRLYDVKAEEEMPLLWLLRDMLELTGTKYGCGIAQCGACTVLLDGKAVRSCSLPLAMVGEAQVVTIEALSGPEADAVRKAWVEIDVPQCGFCQSGQIVNATALLREQPNPTAQQIDDAMNGNICRCGTYPRIRKAIRSAAAALQDRS